MTDTEREKDRDRDRHTHTQGGRRDRETYTQGGDKGRERVIETIWKVYREKKLHKTYRRIDQNIIFIFIQVHKYDRP